MQKSGIIGKLMLLPLAGALVSGCGEPIVREVAKTKHMEGRTAVYVDDRFRGRIYWATTFFDDPPYRSLDSVLVIKFPGNTSNKPTKDVYVKGEEFEYFNGFFDRVVHYERRLEGQGK